MHILYMHELSKKAKIDVNHAILFIQSMNFAVFLELWVLVF